LATLHRVTLADVAQAGGDDSVQFGGIHAGVIARPGRCVTPISKMTLRTGLYPVLSR
jgi:hypothetical protein